VLKISGLSGESGISFWVLLFKLQKLSEKSEEKKYKTLFYTTIHTI
jgi:hypothetical protein